MSKVLNKIVEYMKLESTGIYIFINENDKVFYIGKASNSLFERVKSHLYSSHNDKINTFVNESNIKLFIFPIDNKFDDIEKYDKYIQLIEYAGYTYLLENGYESINSEIGFSREIRNEYNKNKSSIDIKRILNFDINLFEGEFKELLLGRNYLNALLKKNRTLERRLEYQINKNKNIQKEIKELKDKNSEDLLSKYKEYNKIKNKIENIELENKYIKKYSNKLDDLIINNKINYEKELETVKENNNKEIYRRNSEIEELKYKLNFMNETPMLNEIIKSTFIKVLQKLKSRFDDLIDYLQSTTHYRSYGDDEVYNIHRKYKNELNYIISRLSNIIENQNIFIKTCTFKKETQILESMRFCINMWQSVNNFYDYASDAIVEEYDDKKNKQVTINLSKEYIKRFKQYNNHFNKIIDEWEKGITG